MKVAEALIKRADLKKRMAQLHSRISENMQYQEGDAPRESVADLILEYGTAAAEFVELVQRINRTNAATEFSDGMTIADAIAERDHLNQMAIAWRSWAGSGNQSFSRYSRTEIKLIPAIDTGALQKNADDSAREYRELDTRIQALNWSTELLD